MANKRDYYDVLGVAKGVDASSLKKAYRRLARQFHPDVNKAADAEDRFKEIQEAYDVLSDDNKRARYDRFGHAGVENGAGGFSGFEGGFGSMADIFEEFFGGGFGGSTRQRRSGPRRGADLRYDLQISFEESVFGVEKKFEIRRPEVCAHCNGSGAEPGTSPTVCPTCKGSGEIRRVQQSILGQFVNVVACSVCQGSGEVITTPCSVCNGRKQVQKSVTKTIKVPAGVDGDTQIRLTGEGSPGLNGGPAGNLYVVIDVMPHEFFQRRGDDVWLEHQINVAQAALGDEIGIPTIEGEEQLVIEPGTQSGRVYRLRGKGVPRLDRTGRNAPLGRGDQNVIVQVVVPRKLTDEQRDLFQQLSKTLGRGEIIAQKEKGFFSQVRDTLGDWFS